MENSALTGLMPQRLVRLERERGGERERERERGRGRERMCVCLGVFKRERMCVCESELFMREIREREREWG